MLSPADHPGVELFLAMGVFPIFMLPAATHRIFAALLTRPPARAAAAPPLAGRR